MDTCASNRPGGFSHARVPPCTAKAPTAGLGFYSTVRDLEKLARAHIGRTHMDGADPVPSIDVLTRSRRAPEGGPEYWMGWGGWGNDRRFEITNGQTFDATSAVLLCREEGAIVVCLTNTQWDGEPGNSERLADALSMRAMDAMVPGCLASFEVAKAAFEAKGAEHAMELDSGPPIEFAKHWVGRIDLGGRIFDASLQLEEDGQASLQFASIVASAESFVLAGNSLQAHFDCEGTIDALGETSPISYLSMTCRRVGENRIAGSTTFALYDDSRAVLGRVPALTSFTRAP